MSELVTLPGRIDTEDVMDVLKKAGTIALGAIGGGLLKEKAIRPLIKGGRADLLATLAELGIGTMLAVFSLSKGPEALFYPALGVAVHAAGDLLGDLLDQAGLLPVEEPTAEEGTETGGGVLV